MSARIDVHSFCLLRKRLNNQFFEAIISNIKSLSMLPDMEFFDPIPRKFLYVWSDILGQYLNGRYMLRFKGLDDVHLAPTSDKNFHMTTGLCCHYTGDEFYHTSSLLLRTLVKGIEDYKNLGRLFNEGEESFLCAYQG